MRLATIMGQMEHKIQHSRISHRNTVMMVIANRMRLANIQKCPNEMVPDRQTHRTIADQIGMDRTIAAAVTMAVTMDATNNNIDLIRDQVN